MGTGDERRAWHPAAIGAIGRFLRRRHAALRRWGTTPRQSLVHVTGSNAVVCALAPVTLLILGGQFVLGYVWPVGILSTLAGLGLLVAGALVLYLDVLWFRRPVELPVRPLD